MPALVNNHGIGGTESDRMDVIITEQYLIVNGECSHLHGHRHDVHSAVDEAGLKLFIQIHKLLLSVGKTEGKRKGNKNRIQVHAKRSTCWWICREMKRLPE